MTPDLTPAQRAAFEARLAKFGIDPDGLAGGTPATDPSSEPLPDGGDASLPPGAPVHVNSIAELKRLGGVPEGNRDATVSYPSPPPTRPLTE